MNTDNITQSAPLAPPHYDLLAHPLVHCPESPSYIGCLDILRHAADLLELFEHINIDDESEQGGLSADAAVAFFWLTHMLKNTLHYVSQTLDDLKTNRDQYHEQLRQSPFFQALQVPDADGKECRDSALEACLAIHRSDINAFIRLIDEGGINVSAPSTEED
ncbi:MAG: hypothetical protein JKY66_03210 [Spongiibacteraceae bacterium]|nr:hypothetical protein [Spongiibacteraceae bacterium]